MCEIRSAQMQDLTRGSIRRMGLYMKCPAMTSSWLIYCQRSHYMLRQEI